MSLLKVTVDTETRTATVEWPYGQVDQWRDVETVIEKGFPERDHAAEAGDWFARHEVPPAAPYHISIKGRL